MCQQEKLGGGWANILCIFHLYLAICRPWIPGWLEDKPFLFGNAHFQGRKCLVLGRVIKSSSKGFFNHQQENIYSTHPISIRFSVGQTGGFLPDSCLERLPAVIDLRFVSEGATFFFAHGTMERWSCTGFCLGINVCFFFVRHNIQGFLQIYQKTFLKSRIGCTMEITCFWKCDCIIWVFPNHPF